jgi:hypothetical protein
MGGGNALEQTRRLDADGGICRRGGRRAGLRFAAIQVTAQTDALLTSLGECRASKPPSTEAFTDFLNRALDKPKEQAFDVNMADALGY